jgi:hypothetical protein
MRIGVVGSRRRTDFESVRGFVSTLKPGDVVVSGGCKGVDTWAVRAAEDFHISYAVHLPYLNGVGYRHEATTRYYARNEEIVKDCDVLVAFVSDDRTGGTENTILHANRLGVRYIVVPFGVTISRDIVEHLMKG